MIKSLFGKVGYQAGFILGGLAKITILFLEVMRHFFRLFYKRNVMRAESLFRQMIVMGVDSIGIIGLVGASVGAVLALQSAYSLKDFGAISWTGGLVCVAMARELGPLIAAIVISGRVGARMAAELGSMKVQEEVDALETMGINPVRYLILPRFIALLIMLPCLTIVADAMGMLGGYLISRYGLGINPDVYVANSIEALVLKDIYTGLLKSVIFSVLIVLVSCHQGLAARGGADAVGRATTQAVVLSIVLIIFVDCLATAVIYYALPN